MKAYQCSKCRWLEEDDIDDIVFCRVGIDARPSRRYQGLAKECLENFEPLDEKEQWHEPFYWERGGEK
ncbi:MAG: hypothetical protein VB031_02340 [Eubacteriaceae bacterium]|nr:hypothetical protein [Eubacteriaceae bacterium]